MPGQAKLALRIVLFAVALILTQACEQAPATSQSAESTGQTNTTIDPATLSASDYSTTEWTDLMPEDDLQALLEPPQYVSEVMEGSEDDIVFDGLQAAPTGDSEDRYQQALNSTRVRDEFDGQLVRIPGYLVPLEYDDNKRATQLFLVPYFGACIHVPPPPPNQIILVDAADGMPLDDIYTPFWLSGQLTTTLTENDVATSAYSLNLHQYEVYSE